MPYTAEINRQQPGCLVFLLDQSDSMNDPFAAEPGQSKAQGLADAINRLLLEVILASTRDDGVRNYFDIAVIGYTTDDQGTAQVRSVLQGALQGRDLVTVSDLAGNPLRNETRKKKVPDGAGGLVEVDDNIPIWVEPTGKYGTPMNAALTFVHTLAESWLASHPNNFPPIVFHITDGESQDGDPVMSGQRLMSLSTTDGNLLVTNCHLSEKNVPVVLYPDTDAALPDQFAHQLYQMSSTMPDQMVQQALQESFVVTQNSRAFVFNADLVRLIQFLNVGTRGAQNSLR